MFSFVRLLFEIFVISLFGVEGWICVLIDSVPDLSILLTFIHIYLFICKHLETHEIQHLLRVSNSQFVQPQKKTTLYLIILRLCKGRKHMANKMTTATSILAAFLRPSVWSLTSDSLPSVGFSRLSENIWENKSGMLI